MTTTEDRDRLARLEAAYEFVRENMATQADIARLEGRMDTLSADLNGRMDTMQAHFNGRMGTMQADLNGRMDIMQTHFNGRMDALETRLLIRFSAGGIALAGLIIGVLKFWA